MVINYHYVEVKVHRLNPLRRIKMNKEIYIPLEDADELAMDLNKGDIIEISYKLSSDPDEEYTLTCEAEVIDNETVISMDEDQFYTRLVIKIGEQYYISSITYGSPYTPESGYDTKQWAYSDLASPIKFVQAKQLKKIVYDYIPM